MNKSHMNDNNSKNGVLNNHDRSHIDLNYVLNNHDFLSDVKH